MTLKGKCCIVTGGGRGIGRAVARRLCGAGARVMIVSRTARELDETARLCAGQGGECVTHVADLQNPREIETVFERCQAAFGRLDVLVNNAGVAPLAPVAEMTDDDFERLLAINVRAVFYACRAAWPALVETEGTIVNISSLSADDPFPGFAAYGGTKAWVNTFSQALAGEGEPLGVRVFVIAPGAVETQMLRSRFPDFPAERTLDPDAIAAEIEALLTGRSSHHSGDVIRVKK